MKKVILIILTIILLLSLPVFVFAKAEDGDCICGRKYITESSDENELYTCTGCQKNFLLCICDCFCGNPAETQTDESGNTIKICSGCKNSASECTCIDRETALSLEKMIKTGGISESGIRLPKSPAALMIIVIITALLTAIWIFGKKFINKNLTQKEIKDTEKENKTSFENRNFENYRILHSLYEEISPEFPDELFPEDSDAIHLTEKDVELFKKALIGEETDISYFLNIISQKLLDSSLFPTEKGLYTAKILYEKTENYRIGFGLYETVRVFKNGEKFDIRLEQGDKISIYLSVTAPEVAALLRRCINHRPKRDFELEKTNVALEKDEWLLFVYILYTTLKTFSKESLKAKENIVAFMKKTKGQFLRDFRHKAETILKNNEIFEAAFTGLSEKGFFKETEFGEYEIKESIFKDFDPVKFRNIVYFEELENEHPILHINFILNQKGGVAIFDAEEKTKLISSFTIPWAHYIR